jgi:phage baseplate assembly protein gpV
MYHGQILNLTPTQWIRFSATGVEIHSPNGVTITTPNDVTIQSQTLTINANVLFNGTVVANGHVIDERHEHTGVVSGSANTGPVT